jgi:hypothetical protein
LVPGAAIARIEKTLPLGVETIIDPCALSGSTEMLKTSEITRERIHTGSEIR